MGEVVMFAKDGEDEVCVHPYGWERGQVVKGKWEGDYASLRVVKGGTVFKNGTCKNGKLHGEVWETMTFPAEDGLGKATFILTGNYIEGKKEGVFNQYQNGRKLSVAWYEDNKRVSAKSVEV